MASILTCDHCHQPLEADENVRVEVIDRRRYRLGVDKGKSLKDRAQAAAADAQAALATIMAPGHYDLHPQCYDEVIAPAIASIGTP